MLVQHSEDLKLTIPGDKNNWNYFIITKQTSEDQWSFAIVIKNKYVDQYIKEDKFFNKDFNKAFVHKNSPIPDDRVFMMEYTKRDSKIYPLICLLDSLKEVESMSETINKSEGIFHDISSIGYYMSLTPEFVRIYMKQYNKQVKINSY